jgi:hypothetical protein
LHWEFLLNGSIEADGELRWEHLAVDLRGANLFGAPYKIGIELNASVAYLCCVLLEDDKEVTAGVADVEKAMKWDARENIHEEFGG